jgi:hypothetical protein
MSFLDSLQSYDGDLLKDAANLGGKYLEYKAAKENKSAAVRTAETIQPALAQPKAPNPTKGINANGETLINHAMVKDANNAPFGQTAIYAGVGVLSIVGLALAYKLIK